MKKIKILIALSAIVFAFAGCNSCNQNKTEEKDPIKIGAILALSGEAECGERTLKMEPRLQLKK